VPLMNSLFYSRQEKHYANGLAGISNEIGLTAYKTVLDAGCGTGALCSVLKGYLKSKE